MMKRLYIATFVTVLIAIPLAILISFYAVGHKIAYAEEVGSGGYEETEETETEQAEDYDVLKAWWDENAAWVISMAIEGGGILIFGVCAFVQKKCVKTITEMASATKMMFDATKSAEEKERALSELKESVIADLKEGFDVTKSSIETALAKISETASEHQEELAELKNIINGLVEENRKLFGALCEMARNTSELVKNGAADKIINGEV